MPTCFRITRQNTVEVSGRHHVLRIAHFFASSCMTLIVFILHLIYHLPHDIELDQNPLRAMTSDSRTRSTGNTIQVGCGSEACASFLSSSILNPARASCPRNAGILRRSFGSSELPEECEATIRLSDPGFDAASLLKVFGRMRHLALRTLLWEAVSLIAVDLFVTVSTTSNNLEVPEISCRFLKVDVTQHIESVYSTCIDLGRSHPHIRNRPEETALLRVAFR